MIDIYRGNDTYENYLTEDVLKNRSFLIKAVGRRNMHEKASIVPYLVDSKGNRPAVLILPGGAFMRRYTELEGIPLTVLFNRLGINAFILNYRLAPYFYPVPLEDTKRAIRYIRHHADKFGINPVNIGMTGFSAGGHLVGMAATSEEYKNENRIDEIDGESIKINYQILSYPVIYISGETIGMKMVRQALFGKNRDNKLLEETSACNHVTGSTAKAFIWHTAADTIVPVIHSQKYAKALQENNVPCELHIYSKGPHGMSMCDKQKYKNLEAGSWVNECERWIKDNVLL